MCTHGLISFSQHGPVDAYKATLWFQRTDQRFFLLYKYALLYDSHLLRHSKSRSCLQSPLKTSISSDFPSSDILEHPSSQSLYTQSNDKPHLTCQWGTSHIRPCPFPLSIAFAWMLIPYVGALPKPVGLYRTCLTPNSSAWLFLLFVVRHFLHLHFFFLL